MDDDLRTASVTALSTLGRSRDYRDRADAGSGLAAFAEIQSAVGPLLELVLDPDDTFVTRTTAQALLSRKDRAGVAIVAFALAFADANHADWIHTAIVDVFSISASDRDDAAQLAEDLVKDSDSRVSQGARQLLDTLTELNPVLRPS